MNSKKRTFGRSKHVSHVLNVFLGVMAFLFGVLVGIFLLYAVFIYEKSIVRAFIGYFGFCFSMLGIYLLQLIYLKINNNESTDN
jgi:hypothetical protein